MQSITFRSSSQALMYRARLRAMSQLGQNRKSSRRAYVFRFTPESGLKSDIARGPKSATSGHSSAGHLTRRWHPMTVKRAIAATA
jgi:hypothetical protein